MLDVILLLPFAVVLLFCHRGGSDPAVRLDAVHEPHRDGLHRSGDNCVNSEPAGGFPAVYLELFPIGERAFKQLR